MQNLLLERSGSCMDFQQLKFPITLSLLSVIQQISLAKQSKNTMLSQPRYTRKQPEPQFQSSKQSLLPSVTILYSGAWYGKIHNVANDSRTFSRTSLPVGPRDLGLKFSGTFIFRQKCPKVAKLSSKLSSSFRH